MKNSNIKKQKQLGMPIGTASGKLKKNLLFLLVKQLDKNYCYQCGAMIETADELSIEHKTPWLDSEDPKGLYFNLDNIAFSHLTCNCGAARQTKPLIHPSWSAYKAGCRCRGCMDAANERVYNYRARKKL